MSGLFTAAFLRQIGWDTDVYERSTVELAGSGPHPELLEALRKSGAGTRVAVLQLGDWVLVPFLPVAIDPGPERVDGRLCDAIGWPLSEAFEPTGPGILRNTAGARAYASRPGSC